MPSISKPGKAPAIGGKPSPSTNSQTSLATRIRKAVRKQAPKRVEAVFDKLHALAVDGNVSAAKVYLAYVLGKPEQHIRIDKQVNSTAEVRTIDVIELLKQHPGAAHAIANLQPESETAGTADHPRLAEPQTRQLD